jgi:hypothetical protein
VRWAPLAAALALAACAPSPGLAPLPSAPLAAGDAIRVTARPVPLWPEGAARPTGRFAYAGGLVLDSADTSRFHGLSDLDVGPDGRFVAVSDEGDLVNGRIVLDADGAPSGMAAVTLTPLANPQGRPLSGDKSDSDAEGLALWPNGDLMVSFERNHRIWLYPAAGGPPRAIPSPDAPFPANAGMEAVATDPAAGAGAYLVGREDTRETWVCRLDAGCAPGFRAVAGELSGSLVSARALDGGRWAFLLRDYSPLTGSVIHLVVADAQGRAIDTLELRRPATVDNFEGLAAVPRPSGGAIRFYLLSDDNFSAAQRTLLLAFDWTPPEAR